MATIGVAVWVTLLCGALNGQQARSVWDGVYSPEQAKRGEALYGQHCAACHGGDLRGIESAPALAGLQFSENWSGLTVGDLFERIRTSMPIDDPGKVTAQQKVDIIAHMLRVDEFPAGTVELPRDQQVLTQIKYLSTKP
jgi:mono/diheme cytochrome c family protein